MSARLGRPALGIVLALVLTVPLVALLHDVLPAHPPALVSWSVALGTVAVVHLIAGRSGARLLADRAGLRRSAAALLGAAVGAVPVTAPLVALLRAPTSPIAQLAWTLGEEDNAQIIGLAREVIMNGPAGGVLADQYGTGFVVLATTLMRMVGAPDPTSDPRLLAIHAFTLSTLLAALLVAAAVALAVLTNVDAERRPRVAGLMGLAGVTGAAVVVAHAVTIVLPMRTGFLSFVWGIAWIVLGAAVTPLVARGAPRALVGVVCAHVVVTTLLTIRSWPFLGAATLSAIVVAGSLLPIATVTRVVRRRPVIAGGVVVVVLAGTGLFLRNSALGEVLSYGLEALTISASGIAFDPGLGWAVAGATAAAALLARGRGWRTSVAVAGPATVGWLSWLALEGASWLLTGGELNYGGAKLLYGVVAVATATSLPALLTAWAGRRPSAAVARLLAGVGAAVLLAGSATVGTVGDWAERLAPASPPHAVAMIEAIERTTPELPVRCRPNPGTVATPSSRWAAYFCVRWVEDALNGEDRSRGYRSDYLEAPEGTLDPIVAQATAEGHYGFAYVLPLGPGWFGWDGRS